jgi:hypothetical protein
MMNKILEAESFLSNGWVRFIGIPIILAVLTGVYLLLSS